MSRQGNAVPISWQASAVERELRYRERALPQLISRGRITPERAEMTLRDLRAALATLRRLSATDPLATHDGRRPPEPPPSYSEAAS
ncbi:hypothetical protein JN531_012605 [Flagellatimonas centrodinii]|uniref:hypothetical protein n=1 Tax=Flagellatimonas centrodinii TaxID=2806210 RepID=UPI001FEEE5C1|nr:hypothetical protein [Flagellatimonas centrodinii]ULQ45940.1 hypothetical protein JN531_012605 [Flagellatimonas centrodinii]